MTRPARVLTVLACAAVGGIVVFGVMASRAITVERADSAAALSRVEAVRATFGRQPALLVRDADGRLARNVNAPAPRAGTLHHLHVLAYRAASARLVDVDIPFWFFKLKAPAAQYLVRDTGFDLQTLGVTAADLEQQGPGLVLDELAAAGDRLLIWTE